MKKVVILRGIPGSGKTTTARKLIARHGGITHSTDHYFVCEAGFRFDGTKLALFHEKNFSAYCISLRREFPFVVVDNCNICHEDFDRYISAAEEYGYEIEIIEMPMLDATLASKRTTHGVPVETIQKMIDRWEP